MLTLLNTKVRMSDMQRRVNRVVNKAVFAHKKHRAFLVSQSGVKAFYQSVGRPFGVGNLEKDNRGFRVVSGYVGGKRIKHFANAQRGNYDY